MKIVMDAVFGQRLPQSGIGRIYREILPRMCRADPSFEVTLLVAGPDRSALPAHPRIRRRLIAPMDRILRPSRIWWRAMPLAWEFVQRLAVGDGGGAIWHPMYFSTMDHWRGPRVVTIHDLLYERYRDLFNLPCDAELRSRMRRCVMEADAIICVSETTRTDLLSFYRAEASRIAVVPNGCSSAFLTSRNEPARSPSPSERPFLLYVGGRAHYKNPGVLFRAYAVWGRRREIDLLVVGPRWSDSEFALLRELQIAERVTMLDGVDDMKLCSLYRAASAFVQTSLYEGFGIPLLEAMACGCPVVASAIPSTKEVAGECPVYFEPLSVDDLTAALETALAEGRNSPRTRLGLERVRRFSWDRTAHETLQVYRGLCSN